MAAGPMAAGITFSVRSHTVERTNGWAARMASVAQTVLRACFRIVGGRRVRARGLREMAKITKPCRPGPLTGRFLKHALSRIPKK
jgi:hypothetical protein